MCKQGWLKGTIPKTPLDSKILEISLKKLKYLLALIRREASARELKLLATI